MSVALRHDDLAPRLLADWLDTGRPADLAAHGRQYRRLSTDSGEQIIRAVTAAGLRGRGGAWFPTGHKLAIVAEHRVRAATSYVVVNAAESEPASIKDKLLMQVAPHLVLDGAELAAVAVGARRVTVCLKRFAGGIEALRAAIAERRAFGWGRADVSINAMSAPRWYVSSDATALARFVGGGPAKPRSISTYLKGVADQPTMVSNAETFAHIALIARHGANWFRETGTVDAPGTWLVSLGGAVVRAGVYEVPVGTSTADLLALAGGATEPWQAVLLGGYAGQWVPADRMLDVPISPESLRAAGRSPCAGIVVGLPASACGLAETARVATWMAAQNAKQCGPCFKGTPTIAEEFAALTYRQDRKALHRLRFAMAMVRRRGACSHPDGIVSLVESALRVFADDINTHLSRGGCPWMSRVPTLPVPPCPSGKEPWR
jgi:NADH:ubiquinone oxidoreductase subunit F (NADH-binding)